MLLPFPQDLTVYVVSGTEIELSWQPAGSILGVKIPVWEEMGIDGYRIERSTTDNDADFSPIVQVSETTYRDIDVQPGSTYYYKVSAIIGNAYSVKIEASAKTPPAPPPFPTRLTQQEAIQVAAAFCQSVGNPVTATEYATATAEYRVTDGDTGRPIRFWQPRWKVIFEYHAKLDVVDATSAISLYNNDRLHRLAGDTIAHDEAIQYAEIALRATDQTEEISASPTAKEWSHYWLVEWKRQSQGIPYRDQGVCVSIEAKTGQLRGISFVCYTPPIADASIVLSQQKAYEIAQSLLIRENITYVERDGAETEIVQPNSFWQDRSEKPLDTPVRAVWTFRFSGRDSSLYYFYEVWVDAQIGDVIGGSISVVHMQHFDPIQL